MEWLSLKEIDAPQERNQLRVEVQSFLVFVSMQFFLVSCLESNYETALSFLQLSGHYLTVIATKSGEQVHRETVSRVL